MNHSYPRHIDFESVVNFRDLGGYRTRDGRTVAWRRLFRSAALHDMTGRDIDKLKTEIGPRAVIDLRSPNHSDKEREANVLASMGARHYHIPFRPDSSQYMKEEEKANPNATNMGEIYLYRIREKAFAKKLVDALETIAEPENHPLVFHCSVGKDRTGVLASTLLAALDVLDEDIIEDYTLTAPFMKQIKDRIFSDPKTTEEVRNLANIHWEASADSMALFLKLFRREYGSARGYLEVHGAKASLVPRLEKALLV